MYYWRLALLLDFVVSLQKWNQSSRRCVIFAQHAMLNRLFFFHVFLNRSNVWILHKAKACHLWCCSDFQRVEPQWPLRWGHVGSQNVTRNLCCFTHNTSMLHITLAHLHKRATRHVGFSHQRCLCLYPQPPTLPRLLLFLLLLLFLAPGLWRASVKSLCSGL